MKKLSSVLTELFYGRWQTEVWTCEQAGLTKHFSNECCVSAMRRWGTEGEPARPSQTSQSCRPDHEKLSSVLTELFYGHWQTEVWACEILKEDFKGQTEIALVPNLWCRPFLWSLRRTQGFSSPHSDLLNKWRRGRD